MLFDLRPVDPLRFAGDVCRHPYREDGELRADLDPTPEGWAWTAHRRVVWPLEPSDVGWPELSATGTAATREEAEEAAIEWLRLAMVAP